MKSKKSSKLDLNKKSLLFFQIGLILILFISWQSIEYKIYEEKAQVEERVNFQKQMIEENILIKIQEPAPPKPPAIKNQDFNIVPDDTPLENDPILLVPVDPDPPMPVAKVKFVEKNEDIEVPVNMVEEVPVFPGCEKFSSRADKEACMSIKIKELVAKEFDQDLGSEIGLRGINRIYVTFKVDKNGDVVDIRAKAADKKLENEAFRVIDKIPSLTPGRQGNRPVSVLYAIPIVLKID